MPRDSVFEVGTEKPMRSLIYRMWILRFSAGDTRTAPGELLIGDWAEDQI